jgi:UDP-N-acetyl-2-amino-2-deoxyglucuronate dehydrogenase
LNDRVQPGASTMQGAAAQPVISLDLPLHVAMVTESGGAHLDSYFDALALAPEIGSVALVDPSGEAEALAETFLGAKLTGRYRDLTTMLRDGRPSLALVSMEAVNAPPMINSLLDAECHILAEKPSCVRIEDFEALHRKATARSRFLVLALANRVDPVIIEAERVIREGAIGKVYGIEVHMVADQTRLTEPGYADSWTAQKARVGGGHLIWLGIHWIDLAMFVTGMSLQSVTGMITIIGGSPLDVEDSAVVAMRFETGALGTLTSGFYLSEGYDSHLKVWGSHGWLHLHKHGGVPLAWYSSRDTDPVVRRFEEPEKQDVYHPFVRAVARACAGLQPVPLTADDSLRALRAVFACYRAAETGQTQRIG